ncbi:MAG: ArgR family transcriptional regulator [Legionellales bacterium]|nr:ArgR family transcriptional regulator [Legionellales bacterium]
MSQDEHLDNHILNIVQNNKLSEQIEIQQHLKKRGYDIPQATLSRRLKKLKISKVDGIYTITEYPNRQLPTVHNMQVSETGLIILHTSPGNANSLAYFFDQKYQNIPAEQKKQSEIIGTIAGDDTVLIIVRKLSDIEKVTKKIQLHFPYLID